MEYHEQLRKKRREKGFTQKYVAALISKRRGKKIDQSRVSRWESGAAFPNHENRTILNEIYA